MVDWDKRFLDLAFEISKWSKDDSTKVGAVIIGPDKEIRSTGYNGFPRGVNDSVLDRKERPRKYLFTEHAERNAIYNASRFGVSLEGCTIYMASTKKLPICCDCVRGIVQSGIKKAVTNTIRNDSWNDLWKDQYLTSKIMLSEAGVRYLELCGD